MYATVESDIDSRILIALKKHPYGLSTSHLADMTKLSRMTVSRHLEVLRARGFVDYRQVGPAKLWFLSEKYEESSHILKEIELPYVIDILKGKKSKPLREKLGDDVPLHILRIELMAMFLMSGAREITYRLGQEISRDIAPQMVEGDGIEDIFEGLATIFEKLKIGILELSEKKENRVKIRIYECVTCSGLSDIGKTFCYFEGGLMAGAYEAIKKKPTNAVEIKCWATGYEFCEFDVEIGRH